MSWSTNKVRLDQRTLTSTKRSCKRYGVSYVSAHTLTQQYTGRIKFWASSSGRAIYSSPRGLIFQGDGREAQQAPGAKWPRRYELVRHCHRLFRHARIWKSGKPRIYFAKQQLHLRQGKANPSVSTAS